MGASIFNITRKFDEMILRELEKNCERQYLFISSGAVYGKNFTSPVNYFSNAIIPINEVEQQDYYMLSKLCSEIRHRMTPHLRIVDLRIFNYFSRSMDIEARFLITDIARSIRDKSIFQTSCENITRDILHPVDFFNLVELVSLRPELNCAIDCFSKEPVDKISLIKNFAEIFGLKFNLTDLPRKSFINATGEKEHYFSLNHKAAEFGYNPLYSSLDGAISEMRHILAFKNI
jgi:nucleoside-diphosphate-sugar epimerase